MSDEYVRKVDAKDTLQEKVFHNLTDEFYGAMQVIDELPPADVVPVVHAYWEGEETDCNIKCHKCGKVFRDYIITQDYVDLNEYPNFCPNCGAKMDA